MHQRGRYPRAQVKESEHDPPPAVFDVAADEPEKPQIDEQMELTGVQKLRSDETDNVVPGGRVAIPNNESVAER